MTNLNINEISFVAPISTYVTVLSYCITDAFVFQISNLIANEYYVKIYPVIDSVVKSDRIDRDGSNSGNVIGNRKRIFTYKKFDINSEFIDTILTTATISFQVHVYDNKTKEFKGIISTTSYVIDNGDINTAVNHPVITPANSTGISESYHNGHILYPVNGIDDLQLTTDIEMDRSLEAASINEYYHTLYFRSNSLKTTNLFMRINRTSNAAFSPSTLNFNSFALIKEKYADLSDFVGSYFHGVQSTDLVGSAGTSPSPMGYSNKSFSTIIPNKIIYAWQHRYNFSTTRLYYASDSIYNFKLWQIDSSKNLILSLKAVKDSRFDEAYASKPWPKIKYKIKIFCKEMHTPTAFKDNGYSVIGQERQNFLNVLYSDAYDCDEMFWLMTGAVGTFTDSIDNEITININAETMTGTGVSTTANATPPFSFTDNANMYMYVITQDELGYYQGIYINKAINDNGTITGIN